MRKMTRSSLHMTAGIGFAISMFLSPIKGYAQDASLMSCNELWYARNEIYAQNGFCFKTARAQAAFGPGCFPPFGRLSGAQKRRVDQLQSWERRRGCPV